ncbi:MAG: pyrroline-5-carboxylate reductase [Nitrospirota bacterium]
MFANKKIAFLGGGNMAEALIKGLLAANAVQTDQILVADISYDRLEYLKKTYGIVLQKNNIDAVKKADIILLSVKPQTILSVLGEIASTVEHTKLVISIAAGIPFSKIEPLLPEGSRVVRVMPNTPALVLAGAAGICKGTHATANDLTLVQRIFHSVGKAVIIEEKLMDAVVGLSGSGPAYVFTIIEALSDAGVKAGLGRSLALELAAQTVFGAAKMVLETGEHPGKLRDMVASPGGTTIEGLHTLEKGKIRATLMNAVEAATARSKELGKQV